MTTPDRPYLDPRAEYMEEGGNIDGIWPCTSRRRHAENEWDDYIVLYDVRLDILQGDRPPESMLYGMSELDKAADEIIAANKAVTSDNELTCEACGYLARTKRGLAVHLSRRHDIRSDRADYYKEWNQR